MIDNTIYLEEGIDELFNCPKCGREMCFLPDVLHKQKVYGSFKLKRWNCFGCKTEFFQTNKNYNIGTVEGAKAYLESEGINVEGVILIKELEHILKRIKQKY